MRNKNTSEIIEINNKINELHENPHRYLYREIEKIKDTCNRKQIEELKSDVKAWTKREIIKLSRKKR